MTTLRRALLMGMILAAFRQDHASAATTNEIAVRKAIAAAGRSSTVGELTTIVRTASQCCSESAAISTALTRWLRESHPIYAEKLPTEVHQFRGFLLASLSAFPPDAELYGYVRNELQFGGHPFGIAAAAAAARSFPEKSNELIPLLERFLDSSFADQSVDITTPELNYPLAHPTRARHEILRTLTAFGHRAYRSVAVLDAIAACRDCGTWGGDPGFQRRAAEAAAEISKLTPACCRKTVEASATTAGLRLIERQNRKPIALGAVKLLDQDGKSLKFGDLRGRPYVLTFFYSQCTNPLKCVSTVRQLQHLAAECGKDDLARKVGIYGMTYDAHFDAPSILKQYGRRHGMQFQPNVRLLKTVGDARDALRDQLQLRVSYGAGSVNQHGIQLFVFDKAGRLAATVDNELWSPAEVKSCLAKLAAE